MQLHSWLSWAGLCNSCKVKSPQYESTYIYSGKLHLFPTLCIMPNWKSIGICWSDWNLDYNEKQGETHVIFSWSYPNLLLTIIVWSNLRLFIHSVKLAHFIHTLPFRHDCTSTQGPLCFDSALQCSPWPVTNTLSPKQLLWYLSVFSYFLYPGIVGLGYVIQPCPNQQYKVVSNSNLRYVKGVSNQFFVEMWGKGITTIDSAGTKHITK